MPKSHQLKSGLLFLGIFFAGMVFVINSSAFSARKPLWLDEIYAYREVISRYSYSHLLFSGATSEGSPSPLDYLFTKFLYSQRRHLSYLNLSPFLFFRFQNLIYLFLGMAYLIYLLRHYPHSGTVFLIYWLVLVFFLFNRQVAYFASESRPYFLWVILSLVCLYQLRLNPQRSDWLVTILLLSLTSTAAVYQIVSIGIVGFLIALHNKPAVRVPFWWLLGSIVMSIICLYYISRVSYMGYPLPAWGDFWKFYRDYLPFIILGIWSGLSENKPSSVGIKISSLMAAGWLVLGPFSFVMTISKGFFFDPRQYIYYLPAILFILANCLYSIRRPVFLSSALIIWGSLFLIRQTSFGFGLAARLMVYGQPVSIPVNFTLISDRIPGKIPAGYDFLPNPARSDSLNQQARDNMVFWWEYLTDVYPEGDYPRDSAARLIIRARDLNSELVRISYE